MIEENKNNNETNNGNLDYSFDFASQVNKPEDVNAQVATTETAPVTSPVPETEPIFTATAETTPVVDTLSEPSTEVPTMAPVENTVPSAENAEAPKMVDVSVPVMDATQSEEGSTSVAPLEDKLEVNEQVQTINVENNVTTKEEKSSNKSAFTFVVVLAVIIVAFIVALPFIKNYLG